MIDKATDGISVAEAAFEMGVTPPTIRSWINRGLLPAVMFGGTHTRIDPDDLVKLRKTAEVLGGNE